MDQVIQEVYRLKNMAAAHESATQTRIERMMEKCKNKILVHLFHRETVVRSEEILRVVRS